jgi:hypothetical protein
VEIHPIFNEYPKADGEAAIYKEVIDQIKSLLGK